MRKIRIFQTLVVASLAAYLIFFFLPLIPFNYSDETERLLYLSGYGGLIPPGHPLFYIVSISLKVISAIGLFLFLAWGRWLFLAHVVISFGLMPFTGISIFAPIDGMIGYLSSMLDGALLMLCFTQPYSDYIRRDDGANLSLNPDAASQRPLA